MPIKTRQLDRGMIGGRKSAPLRLQNERRQQSDADNHVHGMHPRHGEIKRKEDFRLALKRPRKRESAARHEMLYELRVIFEKLDTEEHRSQNDRQNQEDDQCFPFVGFGAVNCQSHGEAAANQHRRIDSSQYDIEMIARPGKTQQPRAVSDSEFFSERSFARISGISKMARFSCCATFL